MGTNYDFRALDARDFESLCADIVSVRESLLVSDGKDKNRLKLETFKRGRDGGIDGRHVQDNGQTLVLQCKHWVESGFAKLLRHLATEELPKIARFRPNRYILATSVPLSPPEKDQIVAALKPWLKNVRDVIGPSDLNSELSRHRFIERRHYKLWLQSADLLASINNHGLGQRNRYWLQEIQRFSRQHVRTASYREALGKLENHHVILISGDPGSGKTTLAEQSCLWLVGQGYRFIRIDESISEAEKQYSSEENQVFYFDDFLGRNFLDALSSREGSRVLHFIRRVRADSKKRFILTTRTTILNRARQFDDRFGQLNPEAHELAVRIAEMSPFEKAKVLYSILWHSFADVELRAEVLSIPKYRQAVRHKNFSPRVVALFCRQHSGAAPPSVFWDRLIGKLDDPAHFWEQPYRNEISEVGRWAIALLVLHGGELSEQDVFTAIGRVALTSGQPNAVPSSGKEFIKPLIGPFLDRRIYSAMDVCLDLCSPSLGDFVITELVEDLNYLVIGLMALRARSGLTTLLGFASSDLLPKQKYVSVLALLVERVLERDLTTFKTEFLICLADQLLAAKIFSQQSNALLREVARCSVVSDWLKEGESAVRFVAWAYEDRLIEDSAALVFIGEVQVGEEPMECCEHLALIRNDLQKKGFDVSIADSSLRNQLLSYWYITIDADLLDSGALAGVEEESLEELRKAAIAYLNHRLSPYPFGFERKHFDEIVAQVSLASVWRFGRTHSDRGESEPANVESWDNFLHEFEEIDEVFAHR